MTPFSQADLGLLALTSRAVPADDRPLSAREVWNSVPEVALDGLTTARMPQDLVALGIDAALASRLITLLSRAPQLAAMVERWQHEGLWTVTVANPRYPRRLHERLGAAAPIVLHGFGDPDVLHTDGVGAVGSRNLSEGGAEVARALGAWVAGTDRPLVTGGARGADKEAGLAALAAAGSAVFVVSDAVTRVARSRELRPHVATGRLCLVTPFHPDARFSPANAMGRNKLIYGLASATLVIASDLTGGTWEGAREATRHGFGDVRVWRGPGEGPGNAALIDDGAMPIHDVTEMDAPRADPPPDRSRLQQLTLGL